MKKRKPALPYYVAWIIINVIGLFLLAALYKNIGNVIEGFCAMLFITGFTIGAIYEFFD